MYIPLYLIQHRHMTHTKGGKNTHEGPAIVKNRNTYTQLNKAPTSDQISAS